MSHETIDVRSALVRVRINIFEVERRLAAARVDLDRAEAALAAERGWQYEREDPTADPAPDPPHEGYELGGREGGMFARRAPRDGGQR